MARDVEKQVQYIGNFMYMSFCILYCMLWVLCNGWEHYVPTDASRFLISCVIQHYAPVVGWGGGGTDT